MVTRRTRELQRGEADAAADASYEEWCRQNSELAEAEEFERDFPDCDTNDAWREADIWLSALEEEREHLLHEYLEITPAGMKKFIPEPMDDDEYHDRLVECYKGHSWRPNHPAEISRRP